MNPLHRLDPHTRELAGHVEEAALRYLMVRERENEERLHRAWEDFLEAYRGDILQAAAIGHPPTDSEGA